VPNTRVKLPARVDYGMNRSSARRSLSANLLCSLNRGALKNQSHRSHGTARLRSQSMWLLAPLSYCLPTPAPALPGHLWLRLLNGSPPRFHTWRPLAPAESASLDTLYLFPSQLAT